MPKWSGSSGRMLRTTWMRKDSGSKSHLQKGSAIEKSETRNHEPLAVFLSPLCNFLRLLGYRTCPDMNAASWYVCGESSRLSMTVCIVASYPLFQGI